MSDYEVSKSTQSTIFRDTLYFTCDLWLTKIDSKSKRFFWFKVHSSYHPRINSACLVFQTQPAEQLALSWCSGKAHQCHLCRCTLITQHFHFSIANLILRMTRVFKIFAEKCFQSINLNFGILRCQRCKKWGAWGARSCYFSTSCANFWAAYAKKYAKICQNMLKYDKIC